MESTAEAPRASSRKSVMRGFVLSPSSTVARQFIKAKDVLQRDDPQGRQISGNV